MCLSIILEGVYPKPEGRGWKAMRATKHGALWFPFYETIISAATGKPTGTTWSGREIKTAKRRRWMESWKSSIKTEDSGQWYVCGFHIFRRKSDAKKWMRSHDANVVVPVKYKEGRLLGNQRAGISGGPAPVIIADKILIL